MTTTLNSTLTMAFVKANLSRVLDELPNRQSFTITRHGKPVAQLVPAVATPVAEAVELPSGVLRPAPDAAARFPRDERRAAVELEVPGTGPKSTARETSAPTQPSANPEPARAPRAQNQPSRALTLADILRASREP